MQSFIMALRSIGANKMRSVLTMLGIIIGVVSLVVLVSLVDGATGSITDTVSRVGRSLLTVNIRDDKGQPITFEDINDWMGSEADMGLIAPYRSDNASARHGSNSSNLTVYGVTPAYYEVQGLQLIMGRWLKNTDVDNISYVCVINQTTASELIGYEDCVGQTLTLDGVEYTVVGVLEDNDESLTAVFGGSMMAYIPYHSLSRLSDTVTGEITSFYVSAAEGGTMEVAQTAIEDILLDRFEDDEDAYSVSSQKVIEEVLANITGVLSILLGGIAAISLIVGGIGIMNIMLVTVTERTREIGIRKAIGASRGKILMQFLLEAVVLCMMGCALGIFLSWAILETVSAVVASTGMVFTLDAGVVLLSVIFCFIIGVIFGLYPANKAAKMKPIDALHYGG